MSQQIVSASQIKGIVNKIKSHHNACYNQIADLKKLLNVEKRGYVSIVYSVNDILNAFKEPLEIFEKKSQSLNDKISRKETKIFLFGKVSVGKSKVINCLLRSNLFVSSASHTTRSFVNVRKSPDSRFVIKYQNKEETFVNIKDLKERIKILGTSHGIDNNVHLNVDELIEIYLPMEDNKILNEDTHIIDCPGAGEQKLITNTIAKHSEDADIFIFVMSNTLTEDDKKFFKYQSKVSCKPDVFILVNKWDESEQDEETDTADSKQTIIQQCSDFLTADCGMDCSRIADRIFFISAKEIFIRQVKCQSDEIRLTNKVKQRCKNFEIFENILEQYVANPQQNKTRRYQTQIGQVNKYIKQKCAEVRRQILDLRNSLPSRYCENITKSARELKDSFKMPFADFKLKLHKQIKEKVDQIKNNDVLNVDLVTTKIALLGKVLEGEIQTFIEDQEKTIVKYFMDNSLKSNGTTDDIKIGKSNKIQIPQYSPVQMTNGAGKEAGGTWFNVTKSITMEACAGLKWMSTNPGKSGAMGGGLGGGLGGAAGAGAVILSSAGLCSWSVITPVAIAILAGTVIGMVLVGGAIFLWRKYCESNESKSIQTDQDKLEDIKAKIFKDCENYIDKVKEHYDTKIQSIIDSIDKLNRLTDKYFKEMGPWEDMS